jgi:CubicO group peptidase (beta-lactamase class C family)
MIEVLTRALDAAGIPGAVAFTGGRHGVTEAIAIGSRGPAGPALALDDVFQLASMTKALTSVAALQLVERGLLSLDAPLADLLPMLGRREVIAGFEATGAPVLRPVARPITLRHLLSHTAGFGYDFVQEAMGRAWGDAAPAAPNSLASLDRPLLFDPGDCWAYGISTDWAGRAVEAASGQRLDAYIAENITGPLGMVDSGFEPPAADRLVPLHTRGADGGLAPLPIIIGGGVRGEFIAGGAGMFGTGADYLRFLRMLLNDGSLHGTVILQPETVAEMTRNQIGALRAGAMTTTMPAMSAPVDWFPDMLPGWGLGFLINPQPGPDGRAAGSQAWAGICNTFFWFDPASDVAAVLLMQLLPFADPGALAVLGAFERAVYRR